MPDQVWLVTVMPGNVPMFFWNRVKAVRYANDRRLALPTLVDRPDGQPVN